MGRRRRMLLRRPLLGGVIGREDFYKWEGV